MLVPGLCALGVLSAWFAFPAAAFAASSEAAAPAGAGLQGSSAAVGRARLASGYGQLPLSFESSSDDGVEASHDPGRRAGGVRFVAHGPGYGLYLTGGGAVLALHRPEEVAALRAGRKARFGHSPQILGAPTPARAPVLGGYATTHVAPSAGAGGYAATDAAPAPAFGGRPASAGDAIKISLVGADTSVQPAGVEPLPGRANYILGNDPAKWRTGVPTYARVRYADVYPGVDLVYYGNQRQLEHDFVVAPGADPRPIRLRFEGAKELRLDGAGNLLIAAASGELALQKPVIYQMADGKRRRVEGGFRLLDGDTVGFALGAWDRSRALVIDPVLSYASYLGGSDQEYAVSIAVNSAGEAYLTGLTWSVDFPLTPGAYGAINYATSVNSVSTAFICKLNASGTALVYSTYLGGDGTANTQLLQGDYGHSIAVDSNGNAYVAGWTYSSNFPVTAGAYQSTNYAATNAEATGFVSKLNPSGTALVYSTYLGGSNLDEPTALALDANGNAYIAGYTFSSNYPVTGGAVQTSNHSPSAWNAFVSKLNSTGSALVYSTYLGGSGESSGIADVYAPAGINGIYAPMSIAVDKSGDAYVAGFARSFDFPITSGAYQHFNQAYGNAGTNLTLSELNPTGSALIYSTYLGGSSYPGDFGTGLAIDGTGNAYVTGYTYSADFPTTGGAYQTSKAAARQTAFASKINSAGSALVYSTFLGGSVSEDAYALALDGSGDLYLTGTTASSNFPVTADAVQSTNAAAASGGHTAFLTELNPSGSGLLYSTFLGGSVEDAGYGVAVGSSGAVYLAGYTASPDFPVTLDALQTIYNSGHNTAFAAAFDLGPPPSTSATATTLQSSANPQAPGSAVAFTATVAPLSGTGVPGGNVVFSIDEVEVATIGLDSSGKAVYLASGGLDLGRHYVLASYQGDSSYASSGDGLTEIILYPPPAIASLAPFVVSAGGAGFSMTVNGTYLYPGATVSWGGIPLTTTYVSATKLTALVGQPRVASAGAVPVTVTSIGGSSAPVMFTITPNSILPYVLGLSPGSATAAGAGITLTVNGANFVTGSRVLWNGALRPTAVVSSTQLTATIPASDIAQPGTSLVSVVNPAPNAASAAAQPFAVVSSAPVATIAAASLAAASDGSGNHLLTLTGTGFLSNSTVQWQSGGAAPASLSTTYVSPWQISAVVTASEGVSLASQPAVLTVLNPAGASAGFTLP